jgi:hypothetical protein
MRKITLVQIGSFAEDNVSKLVRAIALEAETQLKQQSPVDTGRFRSSWQKDIQSLEASVSNNLPYAERLANGWSKQAPEGWVQTIAANMKPYAEAQARNIERSS